MEDKIQKLTDHNSLLKQDVANLKASAKTEAAKIKEQAAVIAEQNSEITAIGSQLASTGEQLDAANIQIKELLAPAKQGNGATAELEKVTTERDAALGLVAELSQQVADQSSVKVEKEILVKVDGKNYLLERRSMHTLEGEVKAEDAAKDKDFLRKLISNGSGNIRLADK